MAVSFETRRAGVDDVDALLFLMEQFYAEAGFALDRPSAAAAFRTLLSNPALGCLWIARSGGEPAGYVVLTIRFTMEHGGFSGQVDDLYVQPDHRRLGVGRSLLEALASECRARHCKALQVEVASTNDAALALYERCGMRVITDGRVIASGLLEAGA